MTDPELKRDIKEIKDRTRRIETRFTRWLTDEGFDTQAAKPSWDATNGVIRCAGRTHSLNEIIEVLPNDYDGGEVDLYVKSDYLMTIFIDP